jgi:hypothetical protein
MTILSKITVASLVAAGALALTATTASARIVCNTDGDCWHVHSDYGYPPEAGLVVHPDDWHWRNGEHFAWHEHEGRGYWHGGSWREF